MKHKTFRRRFIFCFGADRKVRSRRVWLPDTVYIICFLGNVSKISIIGIEKTILTDNKPKI